MKLEVGIRLDIEETIYYEFDEQKLISGVYAFLLREILLKVALNTIPVDATNQKSLQQRCSPSYNNNNNNNKYFFLNLKRVRQ
jgi:hypothetical protein